MEREPWLGFETPLFDTVFDNPIIARDAAIKIPMLDVTADFLRANEADFQFIIVHIRHIGTAADGNIEAGLGHLLDGGFLQAALGQAEF